LERKKIERLLRQVRSGSLSVAKAIEKLRSLPFEDIGFAKVDHHRGIRCGFPEVILGEGKTPEQIVGIAEKLVGVSGGFLATRLSPEAARFLQQSFPKASYNRLARTVSLQPKKRKKGLVLVLSAGTSDIPVAEEARVAAEFTGARVKGIYDVGVAGIHRLFSSLGDLQRASAIVVVAGMEGALPSVVGGMVDKPVIGVPTSVGYGASLSGLAPLLTMLNSCTSNVCVVNIDNGFAAGHLAGIINRIALEGK